MTVDTEQLPDDVESLKKIIVDYRNEILVLNEQVSLLKQEIYGRKSEKMGPKDERQILLFNEAETHCNVDISEARKNKKIQVNGHERSKPGRKPISEDLPRVEYIHDLPEDDRICRCGAILTRIGQDVSERLDVIPPKVQVERHIRYKYACKSCEGLEAEDEPAVKAAPVPAQIIPRSIATPGLLAHVLTGKFTDGLPFYRQEKIFSRMGVELSRATMCNWAIQVYEKCIRLKELMWHELVQGPLIGIDETTVQVLNEPGRKNTSKSYMWIFRGGPPDDPVILYQYRPTRHAGFITDVLNGYSGCIQTDGYTGYDDIVANGNNTHAGCWAHVRRKFHDLKQVSEKSDAADFALDRIQKLYGIEKEAKERDLRPRGIRKLRQNESLPVIREFKKWIDEIAGVAPPKSLLGKAVNYTINEWKKLTVFIDNGFVPIDNNEVENVIRPFVIGRKNWLFSGSPRGAEASAFFYSLIITAIMNGLETYWYLRYLFENLPEAKSDEDFRRLLPIQIELEYDRE